MLVLVTQTLFPNIPQMAGNALWCQDAGLNDPRNFMFGDIISNDLHINAGDEWGGILVWWSELHRMNLMTLLLTCMQMPGRHLLVATNAAEEGLDLPCCEFVVSWPASLGLVLGVGMLA